MNICLNACVFYIYVCLFYIFYIFEYIYIYYICLFYIFEYLSECMSACNAHGGQERALDSLIGTSWVLGITLGTSEEQPLL